MHINTSLASSALHALRRRPSPSPPSPGRPRLSCLTGTDFSFACFDPGVSTLFSPALSLTPSSCSSTASMVLQHGRQPQQQLPVNFRLIQLFRERSSMIAHTLWMIHATHKTGHLRSTLLSSKAGREGLTAKTKSQPISTGQTQSRFNLERELGASCCNTEYHKAIDESESSTGADDDSRTTDTKHETFKSLPPSLLLSGCFHLLDIERVYAEGNQDEGQEEDVECGERG